MFDIFDTSKKESLVTKEYLQECNDAFDIIDLIFATDNLSDEDEKLIAETDFDIADNNKVTPEQFELLDKLSEKYGV